VCRHRGVVDRVWASSDASAGPAATRVEIDEGDELQEGERVWVRVRGVVDAVRSLAEDGSGSLEEAGLFLAEMRLMLRAALGGTVAWCPELLVRGLLGKFPNARLVLRGLQFRGPDEALAADRALLEDASWVEAVEETVECVGESLATLEQVRTLVRDAMRHPDAAAALPYAQTAASLVASHRQERSGTARARLVAAVEEARRRADHAALGPLSSRVLAVLAPGETYATQRQESKEGEEAEGEEEEEERGSGGAGGAGGGGGGGGGGGASVEEGMSAAEWRRMAVLQAERSRRLRTPVEELIAERMEKVMAKDELQACRVRLLFPDRSSLILSFSALDTLGRVEDVARLLAKDPGAKVQVRMSPQRTKVLRDVFGADGAAPAGERRLTLLEMGLHPTASAQLRLTASAEITNAPAAATAAAAATDEP
jgi:uncharacterized membrane protein YgcG